MPASMVILAVLSLRQELFGLSQSWVYLWDVEGMTELEQQAIKNWR